MSDVAVKLATSANEEKRAKFRELGAKRINNVLKAISLIGNLGNRATYEYSEQDVKKMFNALGDALESAQSRFTSGTTKERSGFSF
jgi:hypothetical protein